MNVSDGNWEISTAKDTDIFSEDPTLLNNSTQHSLQIGYALIIKGKLQSNKIIQMYVQTADFSSFAPCKVIALCILCFCAYSKSKSIDQVP